MKCVSCGYELPENAKFCPRCGVKNDIDAVFSCSGGNAMGLDGDIPRRKFSKKLIVGVVVVLAIGIVSAAGIFLGRNHKYVAYLKNSSVNQADLGYPKKATVEYSGDYGEKDNNPDEYVKVKYSKDGKYIFYPTEVIREDDTFYPEYCLNMQKVGKEEDPIKLDNSVWQYHVLEQNKVVYIKSGNNTLYINDKKGHKEKIASHVESYQIDKDEKNIVWIEFEDGSYAIYQQDLALKKEKKELAANVSFYDISENLKQIAVVEEDTLYVIKNFGDKKKISSNVSGIISNSEKTGSVCYCKVPDRALTGVDIVEDDCLESDVTIKEPEYDNFIVQRAEKNEYTGRYERVEAFDQDAYNQAWEQYEAKENRDKMREDLKELEFGAYVKELYCFRDGKEELVEEFCAEQVYDYGTEAKKNGIFAFNRYRMEEVPQIKMSEIESFSDLADLYYENLKKVKETCIYTEKKVITLAENLEYAVALEPEKKVGYGLKAETSEEEETRTYTLMSFQTGESADGSCRIVAEDVDSIQMLTEGKIYYLTDVNESEGELYCNEDYVDSDVFVGSLKEVKDGVAYAVDYDSNKGRATLKLYNGKEDRKIADDVYAYHVFDEKNVVVLVDYSLDRKEGDLKYYKGKDKLAEIDEDVTAIFGGTVFYY